MKEILDDLVRSIRDEIVKNNFTLENVQTSWLDGYDLHASILLDGLTLYFHVSEGGLVYQGNNHDSEIHHIVVLEYREQSDVSKALYNAFKPYLKKTNLSRIAYLEEELNKLKQI